MKVMWRQPGSRDYRRPAGPAPGSQWTNIRPYQSVYAQPAVRDPGQRMVNQYQWASAWSRPGYAVMLGNIFGHNQAWYDRVTRDVKGLQYILAQVTAVGKGLWDAISGSVEDSGTLPYGVKYFPGYDWAADEIEKVLRTVILTPDRETTDSDLALAEIRINEFNPMLEYVKKVAPEVKAQMDADLAQAKAMLDKSRYLSPADAGVDAFEQGMKDMASKVGMGFGVTTIALLGVGLLALSMYAGGGRRYKSNPSKSRELPMPVIAAGAAAVYLFRKKPSYAELEAQKTPVATVDPR